MLFDKVKECIVNFEEVLANIFEQNKIIVSTYCEASEESCHVHVYDPRVEVIKNKELFINSLNTITRVAPIFDNYKLIIHIYDKNQDIQVSTCVDANTCVLQDEEHSDDEEDLDDKEELDMKLEVTVNKIKNEIQISFSSETKNGDYDVLKYYSTH